MTESSSDSLEYRPVWARDAARKQAHRGGGPTFKALIVNLLALAAVAAVVGFFAAPAVAFFGIRAAAEANDAAGLARLIDYPSVRTSLRAQIMGRPETLAPPPSFIEDPIGAVRRQFEDHPIVSQPNVDAYLTPQALSALTRGEGRAANAPSAASTPSRLPRPIYWSVNRARLAVNGDGGARTIFTFERSGPFEWKLVHIGLPSPNGASS